MFSPKKPVLFASLALTLGVIGWALAQTAQKHDAWILGRLKDEFAEDKKLDDVHFTVCAGFVSLKGSVALLEDKRLAATKALAVDHVRTVNNDCRHQHPGGSGLSATHPSEAEAATTGDLTDSSSKSARVS